MPTQPRRLPPAAAPRAGSLRPPPPPPSSAAAAAAAAGKGAEETASLPLPTAQAQQRPPVRPRATSVKRAARALSVGAPRAGGRGYGGSEGSQVRLAPTPASLGLSRAATCRCSSVSSTLCIPLPRSLLLRPHSNQRSRSTAELHGVGPADRPFP